MSYHLGLRRWLSGGIQVLSSSRLSCYLNTGAGCRDGLASGRVGALRSRYLVALLIALFDPGLAITLVAFLASAAAVRVSAAAGVLWFGGRSVGFSTRPECRFQRRRLALWAKLGLYCRQD